MNIYQPQTLQLHINKKIFWHSAPAWPALKTWLEASHRIVIAAVIADVTPSPVSARENISEQGISTTFLSPRARIPLVQVIVLSATSHPAEELGLTSTNWITAFSVLLPGPAGQLGDGCSHGDSYFRPRQRCQARALAHPRSSERLNTNKPSSWCRKRIGYLDWCD